MAFGQEVRAEIRQVTWSTRRSLFNATRIVLVLTTVVAAIAGLDLGFGRALDHLILRTG